MLSHSTPSSWLLVLYVALTLTLSIISPVLISFRTYTAPISLEGASQQLIKLHHLDGILKHPAGLRVFSLYLRANLSLEVTEMHGEMGLTHGSLQEQC